MKPLFRSVFSQFFKEIMLIFRQILPWEEYTKWDNFKEAYRRFLDDTDVGTEICPWERFEDLSLPKALSLNRPLECDQTTKEKTVKVP